MSDELVRLAARAMCIDADFGPDHVAKDGPLWLHYVTRAKAAVAAIMVRVDQEMDKCGEPCPECRDAIRKLGECE